MTNAPGDAPHGGEALLPEEAAALLREWVGDGWTVHPLAGDASVRRYYRIALPDGTTRMLAYYPDEVRPQLRRFLAAYEAVAPHGCVPGVVSSSEAAVLQHDVGDRTLFDLLHDDREEGIRRYRDAVALLVAFQRATADAINPPFTADFFFDELEMTRDFYVEQLMGTDPGTSAMLTEPFRKLADNVASHPYVLCHRDFHGQNLHLFNDALYVIDYQDLRKGPDTYDLASLLRDRGVARILGDDVELALVDDYASRIGVDAATLRHRYFETLLQRSIKILGTFSKQPIVRGRLHYLDFIPATIESIRRCLGELPEHAAIGRAFPMDFQLDATRERLKGRTHGQT